MAETQEMKPRAERKGDTDAKPLLVRRRGIHYSSLIPE
jgi:hypothetical protein